MRRLLSVSVAAVALAVVAGCSGSSGSDSSGAASGQAAGTQPAAPGSPSLPADSSRQVVSTATASLAVKDPAVGAQRISELAESAGGRVDNRVEHAGSGKDGLDGASADLVVRVPADKLTGVLADLKDLGDVESVSVSHSDVTADAVDLDARISALQTSVARLQGLMGQASSTADLLTAEKALTDRQAQLESLQSQRALLADQVQLSTLDVHLKPFGVAPAGGPKSFVGGLSTGWRALVVTLHGAVIALGILLPWLALAAVVAAAVLVLIRRARRRPAVAATSPPVPPQG
jgi:hypothetical protein